MGLPPPKLRDLSLRIGETSSSSSNEVWEIGVPPKNSLYWSIVLSYLFSENGSMKLSILLKNLTGAENEVETIKKKKNINPGNIDISFIRQELKSFNPFKNRHASFHITNTKEVMRIFSLRLKQMSNKFKSKAETWNDELKLNTASTMLGCKIEVFFPKESGLEKRIYPTDLVPKEFSSQLVLFQYKDQEYADGKMHNVFHFAISVQRAHFLKLDALRHFLKKAKIPSGTIGPLINLMDDPQVHGVNFLPRVIQSKYISALTYIYQSPYIAVKLFEAGFHTDPVALKGENPSALCHALRNPCTTYFRILYDYASNCRSFFEKSIRNADEIILETMQQIKDVLASDISKIDYFQFSDENQQRVISVLNQYIKFVDYQYKVASEKRNLRNDLKKSHSEEIKFNTRKKEMVFDLRCYLDFFYYNSVNTTNISDKYINYLNFNEFYDNIDIFAFSVFFDNIYLIKRFIGHKEENLFLNIEWEIFVTMMSKKFFPRFDHYIKCNTIHDKTKCEMTNNVQQCIPLFYRSILENNIQHFINKLKKINKCNGKEFANELSPKPQIVDQLLIERLQMYIKAALEVSPQEDKIRAVLVLERTLQVLGESIKPPSSISCIVSPLLCSCLPPNLQSTLIQIRNDLSHYEITLVHGTLEAEKDYLFFENIKEEIRKIGELFEVVSFIQNSRVEETVMKFSATELKKSGLPEYAVNKIEKEIERIMKIRTSKYEKYRNKCMTLLVNIIASTIEKLKNFPKPKKETEMSKNENFTYNYLEKELLSYLKAMEYLLIFICNHHTAEGFEKMLNFIQNFTKRSLKEPIYNMLVDLCVFFTTCVEEICAKFFMDDISLTTPKILSFQNLLRKHQFTDDEKNSIKVAIDNAYKEATEAEEKIRKYSEKDCCNLEEKEILFERLLISSCKILKLREYFQFGDTKSALEYMDNVYTLSKDEIDKAIDETLMKNESNVKGYAQLLLFKISFGGKASKNIYDSVHLSSHLQIKLQNFLTKRVSFVISRLEVLKNILIDEDEEIKSIWQWGRSGAIKFHNRFLMRQRYMKDITVRVSLEMAFFSCLNILKGDDFKEILHKSNLFSGMNLRNLISHRSSVPETIAGILDPDDFPSDIINKILELIEDLDVIKSMVKLVKEYKILDREYLVSYILGDLGNGKQPESLIETIKKCDKWISYVGLIFS